MNEVSKIHSSPDWFRARRFSYEHVSNQGTVKVSGDATGAVHGLVEQLEAYEKALRDIAAYGLSVTGNGGLIAREVLASYPASGSWAEDIKTVRRLLLSYSTEDATAQEGDAALRRLEEQLEAVQHERDEYEDALDSEVSRRRELQEQLETLRVVLEAAYYYYPKGTPMSESMQDALNPASRPHPKFPLFESGRSDISNQASEPKGDWRNLIDTHG